jgi:flagellar biogenesis protein FliO
LFQVFIKKNKFGLKDKFSAKKRLNIIESVKLSQSEQIRIIRIDNVDYALFSNKGVQPYVLNLKPVTSEKNSSTKNQINNLKKPSSREISSKEPDAKPKIGDAVVPKTDGKMLRAISIARKLNPKVSF